MVTYDYLKTRQIGAVRWLELYNLPVNFLNTDILIELHRAIKDAEQDDSVRVLVLTGGLTGRYVFHFSVAELRQAGHDVRKLGLGRLFKTPVAAEILRWHVALGFRLMRRFRAYERLHLAVMGWLRPFSPTLFAMAQMAATYFAIENCRKVTIAAINGTCNGAGTEMSACFDFRFMIGDAGFTIGQPEVLIGILAGGGGTQRITRLIGKAKALELMLACEQISPQEARRIGLITDHFPEAEFVTRVQAYAERLARRSVTACSETRHAIHHGYEMELSRGLALEMAGIVRCFDDPCTQAALADYADYLQLEVMDQPDAPASIGEISQAMESERFTRHFAVTVSPKVED